MYKFIFFFTSVLVSLYTCYSQITIVSSGATGNQVNVGSAYTQDFNSLPSSGTLTWSDNSSIAGWYVTDEKNSGSVNIVAGTGSSNVGNSYSFGSSTSSERAMGYLGSGSQDYYNCALRMVNNTGAAIQSFSVSFTGEQWRCGGNSGNNNNKLEFFYQVGSSISMPTRSLSGWTAESNLNFSPPIRSSGTTALNGNNSSARSAKSHSFNVTVAHGSEIYFLWHGGNGSGSDAGLAIDDLSITPSASTVPVEFLHFDAEHTQQGIQLNWSTASELNNHFFEIQKSLYGRDFIPIAEVLGHGTTQQIKHYKYTDIDVKPNALYRLRQVDYNGEYAYSKIVRSCQFEYLWHFSQNHKEITIHVENQDISEIVLLSSNGQELAHDYFTEMYFIDKAELVPGIYLLIVRSNNQVKHYKFSI